MKIGIVIYGLDRPITGIGRYTLELVRALVGLQPSPDITLLCAGHAGPLKGILADREVLLPGSKLLPSLMTWGQVAIWHQVRALHLDVIHDPTGSMPLALAKHSAATVTTIHDVFAWSLPGYSSLLDTLIYKQWLTRPWAKTDAIITVSSQSRADIIKYLKADPEKLHIVPYGVASIFQPLRPGDIRTVVVDKLGIRRPYILYVGALTERKNITRLIHAFSKVREGYPELLLVLAGPRSWKQTPIENIVSELGLSEHVHLTGPLTDKELPALYNGAMLFAFPSLYEGFGMPVLEAMACGTPVITSNVSSLPEVAGDAGIMVDPEDVDALTEAIRRIVSDCSLREKLRELGLVRASRFSWQSTATQTLAVYEKVGGS